MPSSTDNVKLGVCTVLFDGQDLGYTKGGVEVEVTTQTHVVTVDQFGETPISELITGRQVTAKVPLAETTLDNIMAIMPGASIVTDGVKATGTITFAVAAAANNDAVTILGSTFTFKAAPDANDLYQVAPGATFGASAANLAVAINRSGVGVVATVVGGVVTVTSTRRSVDDNVAITKTNGANITVVGLTGGVTATKARVVVTDGVSINLLDVAKKLTLRPKGTKGKEDFIIYKAATAGQLNFTYSTENERIFSTEFKGYVSASGNLFSLGVDVDAG